MGPHAGPLRRLVSVRHRYWWRCFSGARIARSRLSGRPAKKSTFSLKLRSIWALCLRLSGFQSISRPVHLELYGVVEKQERNTERFLPAVLHEAASRIDLEQDPGEVFHSSAARSTVPYGCLGTEGHTFPTHAAQRSR